MRIALLGANGQLGQDVDRVFSEDGHQVLRLGRSEMDALDSSLDLASKFENVDVIINCTAYTRVDDAEGNVGAAHAINAVFPTRLAQAAKQLGRPLVHYSTDYVFDGTSNTPYRESDPAKPINVYGLSKLAGEAGIEAYCEKALVLRVSSLFGIAGSSGKGGNFIETMIGLGRKGTPLKVVNDQRMAPTHTLDVARATLELLNKHSPYGLYHASGTGACTWYEFAKCIFELTGIGASVEPIPASSYKTPARRPTMSVLDNRKLASLCTMPHWSESLASYLRLKNHLSS